MGLSEPICTVIQQSVPKRSPEHRLYHHGCPACCRRTGRTRTEYGVGAALAEMPPNGEDDDRRCGYGGETEAEQHYATRIATVPTCTYKHLEAGLIGYAQGPPARAALLRHPMYRRSPEKGDNQQGRSDNLELCDIAAQISSCAKALEGFAR